jgi:uncharacterized protein YbcI
MRCVMCGALTQVIETREVGTKFIIRRRRLCRNGHRFNSFEIDESLEGMIVKMATRRNRIEAIEKRIARWHRDQDIMRRARAGEKVLSIAVDLGMPESTVASVVRVEATEKRIAKQKRDRMIVERSKTETIRAIAADLRMPESTVASVVRKHRMSG